MEELVKDLTAYYQGRPLDIRGQVDVADIILMYNNNSNDLGVDAPVILRTEIRIEGVDYPRDYDPNCLIIYLKKDSNAILEVQIG